MLAECEPGFSAYFKKWIADQEKLHGNQQIDVSTKTVLAILACAMAPLTARDLETITSYCNSGIIYIDSDTLNPIDRFVIGDGVESGYVLNHPLFADFLKSEFFKNSRLLDEIQKAFLFWGNNCLNQNKSPSSQSETIPPYLLDYFARHLMENNCALDELDKLLCFEWQQAHLSTSTRHFGFLADIEFIRCSALEMNQRGLISLERRLQTELQCAIYKSSLYSMEKNVPPKLRYHALKYDAITIAQAIKQIELLNDENRRQALIEIFEFLDPDMQNKLISEVNADWNDKNRANYLVRIARHCEMPIRADLEKIAYELIQQTEEPNGKIHRLLELSMIETENKDHYLSEAKNSLNEVSDSGSRATLRIKISNQISGSNLMADVELAINELDHLNDADRKLRMLVHQITECPKEATNLLADRIIPIAGKILSNTKIGSFLDSIILEEAIEALILCAFIKELNIKGLDFATSIFLEYIRFFKLNILHYQQAETIIEFYKVLKIHALPNKTQRLEELECEILEALGKLPSGNNITHKLTDFVKLADSSTVRAAAINRALIAAERIDDSQSIINFLCKLAQTSSDEELRATMLSQATELATAIIFTQNQFDCFV